MPTTPILAITQVSASQNNKEVTINDAIEALEQATNARLDVSFASSTDITLSTTQATRSFIFVAINATAGSTLRFPNTINSNPLNRVFAVRNNSGQALTVRFATGSGTTVSVPDGQTRLIAALNGTDMIVAAEPGTVASLLSLPDTPSSYVGNANKALVVNVAENALEFVTLATFPSFVANAGKVLAVRATEDGVEWVDATEAATFTDLLDTPNAYTGQAGRFVGVNEAENGLAFLDTPDPEAVRYVEARRWRILVTETSTAGQTGFGEIAFFDKDGFNLVGSGTATASNNAAGFEPDAAFDTIVVSGTGWLTETGYAGPIWIEYEFPTAVSVRSVRLNPITDAANFAPLRFKIQVWTGTEWADVGERVPAPWVSGNPQTFRANGLPFVNLYPMGGFFFTEAPASNEVLFLHTVTEPCTLAADFAGSRGRAGTNPGAVYTMPVAVNGSNVGTISINTSGVFTFNSAGAPIALVPGDQIRVTAPAVVDTAQNVSVTFRAVM